MIRHAAQLSLLSLCAVMKKAVHLAVILHGLLCMPCQACLNVIERRLLLRWLRFLIHASP